MGNKKWKYTGKDSRIPVNTGKEIGWVEILEKCTIFWSAHSTKLVKIVQDPRIESIDHRNPFPYGIFEFECEYILILNVNLAQDSNFTWNFYD